MRDAKNAAILVVEAARLGQDTEIVFAWSRTLEQSEELGREIMLLAQRLKLEELRAARTAYVAPVKRYDTRGREIDNDHEALGTVL